MAVLVAGLAGAHATAQIAPAPQPAPQPQPQNKAPVSLAPVARPPGGDPLPELPFTPLEKVVVRGTGTIPLVLIADYGMDWRLWDSFIERNQSRYKMYAITLPGLDSTTAPAAMPKDSFYGDGLWTRNVERGLLKLLDDNKIDKAFFIGQAYGGHIALRMAIQHPDRTSGAMSLDGTVTVELPNQKDPRLPREQREAFVASTVRAGERVPDDKFYARQKQGLASAVADPQRAQFITSMLDGAPKNVFLQYLAEYYAADMWAKMADLQVPAVVVVPVPPRAQQGAQPTRALKAKWTKWFQAARKNCEVIWFENSLPLLTESAPFELDRAVHAFVHGNFVPGRSTYSKPLTEYKAPEEGGPPETPRVSSSESSSADADGVDEPATDGQDQQAPNQQEPGKQDQPAPAGGGGGKAH